MNKRLIIKNIKSLVSCDKNDNLYESVNMLIENGVIKYIGKELYEADESIDATNMLVYPGLINTHHHLYQTFTRNLPKVQKMELFPWLTTLYEIWKGIDSEVIRYSSLVGMGELMKSGCTTCFDHHYVFPKGVDDTLIDTQFVAAKELGIRMHASRGSMSLSKKDGGLPPDSVVQTMERILYDSERLVKKFHDPKEFSMNQVALAPCSPFSVTSDLMKESAKLARKLGVRLHTHLAETIDEEKFTLEKFGMRPLEYMESLGWVGKDVWYAHGIHFNDYELKILARTQSGVAHCPISNMKLSSGIARIPEMIKMGIPVGLAVDGSASNDGSNLLEEIRVAYLLHRLKSSTDAPTGYEILKLATKGSASVLGRDDIGELSVGKAADLFMINSKKLEFVGTQFDPKSILGTVGFKGAVDYTIVGGNVVVKEGKLVNIDEEKITYEANEAVERLIKKA
ncbi:8-oxoguanine deaminase [Clostridium gasigenes]|uniref:8-oxoguanine deaminase n=1 Tax=Clostridium gasigenes TaxID=94869 RepID=UPI00143847F6|nr:8-oxoguanine deaminase [Clostridium gasigenes]NKF05543.1 8-oxoguanine deaminase [Clostridium gasigenes]QSW18985.1 8-oxoguanine deaminase [Clostridium gasigenes]